MNDTECPYCGADVEINHDDGCGYAEDELHQQECGKCEKIFTFWTSISFHYTTNKADCLNGEPHKYELTKTYPKEFSRMECATCGDRIKPTSDSVTKDDVSPTPNQSPHP